MLILFCGVGHRMCLHGTMSLCCVRPLVNIRIKIFHIFHILYPIWRETVFGPTHREGRGKGTGTSECGAILHWLVYVEHTCECPTSSSYYHYWNQCWANMIQRDDTMATDGLTKGIMKFNVSLGYPIPDHLFSHPPTFSRVAENLKRGQGFSYHGWH